MSELYQKIKGQQVRVPCSVDLFADSDGNKRGKTVPAGVYECNYVNPGHSAPIHIKEIGRGDLGWIKCKPTSQILLSNPPVYVLESQFASV